MKSVLEIRRSCFFFIILLSPYSSSKFGRAFMGAKADRRASAPSLSIPLLASPLHVHF
jgi:hypothetical protein